jgi:hypoxanthine phosphoribosyltransferase
VGSGVGANRSEAESDSRSASFARKAPGENRFEEVRAENIEWAGDERIKETVVSREELQRRVEAIGREITADYEGLPLLLIGVLKGAFVFMSDLAREIDLPVEIDIMAIASYGGGTSSSGVIRIVKDLDADLTGRHVVVVEDIVDSGVTLSYLRRNLLARNPASLEVAALLVKEGASAVAPSLRYIGSWIPNDFVVGYGLDVAERYRNIPEVRRYEASNE